MTGNDGHPAWQEILNEIPEEYHAFIKPKLQAWDAGVQKKIEDTRAEFADLEAFKFLVDNDINPEYVQQSIYLADQLQADPKKLVTQVNEAWQLGYNLDAEAPKTPPAGEGTEDNLLDLGDGTQVDITKHPKFAEIEAQLNALQSAHETAQQAEQESADLQAFETYLNGLEQSTKEKNLPFDKTFVTALISQGVDGEEAVKQFHTLIASAGVQLPNGEDNTQQQTKQDPPPVVMGTAGSTGGGLPDGTVNYGSLSSNDLNSTIEQLLDQSLNSGQG